MQVNINVKGVSNKAAGIKKIVWEYPDGSYTLEEFICRTAELCVGDYLVKTDADALVWALSAEDVENGAESGKISFGRSYGEKRPDPEKAKETALQAFRDGLVAVFLGEERCEDLSAPLPLKDGSEVTFVKLTFLAGRMW